MRLVFCGHELIFRKLLPPKELKKIHLREEGRKKGWRICPVMAKRMMTREEAVQERDKPKVPYLRIYMCEFCNWWHLTHKRSNVPN